LWQSIGKWFSSGGSTSPIRRARPRLEVLEERTVPAVFTVSTALDSGAGSLRAAITAANANTGLDTINFAISQGGYAATIELESALPAITDQVFIDGFTQGGQGAAQKPWVELDGENTATGNGLTIAAGGVTVRGLAISRFKQTNIDTNDGNGILIQATASTATNSIYACYIGAGLDGTAEDRGNGGAGIRVERSFNTLGSTTAGLGNVISKNGKDGVTIVSGANNNVLVGNIIGLDATGDIVRGNGGSGVAVHGNSTQIGLQNDGGNVISGNGQHGVYVNGSNATLNNNLIGLDKAGDAAKGNVRSGVYLDSGASSTMVGGTGDDATRNVISGNGSYGIDVRSRNANFIRGNYVGTNEDGDDHVYNQFDGIGASNASNLEIGGATYASFGNVIIAREGKVGVNLGIGTTNCLVKSNWICKYEDETIPEGVGVWKADAGVGNTFNSSDNKHN
ncbi:MAG: hypothetical protein K2W96_28040, partial [Gemmataceae bacterium]|nr:hypothetical protein [Gemmataceae bacterium]